eukprot:scaffold1748_cov148-Skeletonema_menzelii.AAC.8
MDVFKKGKGYTPLRRAVDLILCRNDNVMVNWYKFEDRNFLSTVVCGCDQSNNNMKEVDSRHDAITFEKNLDETELRGNSKERLLKFLKDREREDGYNAQRGKQRATTLPKVSTTKAARPSSAAGFTPQPQKLKKDDDNED